MVMPAYRTVLGPARRRRHERTACSSLAKSDIAPSSFLEIPLPWGGGHWKGGLERAWRSQDLFEPVRSRETNRHLDHVAACLSLATRWSPDFLARSSRQTAFTSCPGRHPRDELTIRGRRLVMVHDRLGPLILAVVMMAGLGPNAVRAAGINFTGNVEKDFNTADPNHLTTEVIPVNAAPDSLAQWPAATGGGTWVSGWNIKDIYLSYDSKTGTLYGGLDNWANASGKIAPFGQANGDPSGTPTSSDPAHLGYGAPSSDKSFALVFAPLNLGNPNVPGTPVVIAGVPANKAMNGRGIDGFTVASINNSQVSGGLGYMFGKPLPQMYQGNLAFDPSPLRPQLEFAIPNFNQLIDPKKGFW